jgi:TPR repeat protein
MAKDYRCGIGNLGDIRRRRSLRSFLQVYLDKVAFGEMACFAILVALTIAFLEPQILRRLFLNQVSATQQLPAPATNPTSTALQPTNATAAAQVPAMPESSVGKTAQAQTKQPTEIAPLPKPMTPTVGADPAAAPLTDSTKAIANLLALPPLPAYPVIPVDTPGLHSIAIPLTPYVTSAMHPASRLLTVDERPFINLPYQLREKLKAALIARADEDGDRMREILKDVESPDGTPELLIGMSYLIRANAERALLAEKSYRVALQKGQPQAPVFLGLLLTIGIKGLGGTPEEGKALIQSAMGKDRVAWLATGNSYLSGESGILDPAKAAPLIVKAAEAGEPLALLQYARLAEGGIGMEKNVSLAEGALRRAAEFGLTEAEEILGRWFRLAYEKKFIEDPTEGVRLLEKAANKHSYEAVSELGGLYAISGRGNWKDAARGVKLLQECAAYKLWTCHGNLAVVMQIDRDISGAWAHYDVSRQLGGGEFPTSRLTQLEKTMTPGEKDDARKMSKDVMDQLKTLPPIISLRH